MRTAGKYGIIIVHGGEAVKCLVRGFYKIGGLYFLWDEKRGYGVEFGYEDGKCYGRLVGARDDRRMVTEVRDAEI